MDKKSTYVGATTDVNRRLRQHNNQLSGGAIRTTKKSSKGILWNLICFVEGFPTWRCALQFEWRFKNLTNQLPMNLFSSLDRRKMALEELLSLPKSTSLAIPFCEYKDVVNVVWS